MLNAFCLIYLFLFFIDNFFFKSYLLFDLQNYEYIIKKSFLWYNYKNKVFNLADFKYLELKKGLSSSLPYLRLYLVFKLNKKKIHVIDIDYQILEQDDWVSFYNNINKVLSSLNIEK